MFDLTLFHAYTFFSHTKRSQASGLKTQLRRQMEKFVALARANPG